MRGSRKKEEILSLEAPIEMKLKTVTLANKKPWRILRYNSKVSPVPLPEPQTDLAALPVPTLTAETHSFTTRKASPRRPRPKPGQPAEYVFIDLSPQRKTCSSTSSNESEASQTTASTRASSVPSIPEETLTKKPSKMFSGLFKKATSVAQPLAYPQANLQANTQTPQARLQSGSAMPNSTNQSYQPSAHPLSYLSSSPVRPNPVKRSYASFTETPIVAPATRHRSSSSITSLCLSVGENGRAVLQPTPHGSGKRMSMCSSSSDLTVGQGQGITPTVILVNSQANLQANFQAYSQANFQAYSLRSSPILRHSSPPIFEELSGPQIPSYSLASAPSPRFGDVSHSPEDDDDYQSISQSQSEADDDDDAMAAFTKIINRRNQISERKRANTIGNTHLENFQNAVAGVSPGGLTSLGRNLLARKPRPRSMVITQPLQRANVSVATNMSNLSIVSKKVSPVRNSATRLFARSTSTASFQSLQRGSSMAPASSPMDYETVPPRHTRTFSSVSISNSYPHARSQSDVQSVESPVDHVYFDSFRSYPEQKVKLVLGPPLEVLGETTTEGEYRFPSSQANTKADPQASRPSEQWPHPEDVPTNDVSENIWPCDTLDMFEAQPHQQQVQQHFQNLSRTAVQPAEKIDLSVGFPAPGYSETFPFYALDVYHQSKDTLLFEGPPMGSFSEYDMNLMSAIPVKNGNNPLHELDDFDIDNFVTYDGEY
ncbi:hypothetical protein BABINDRAFT_162447 [Babjeviella inositovora NRRL Y-12698]|uniref:Uncharacterized protein n=1 Tax=Babjeviella inositovora NRRL Y-12698 TaxID=984486 RepID=A0A1E3QM31_9ASCO|nr:uncharacterized protein BABINDRAFT_162447 [Babjeviella inositovora NRRL Y-12698]ODQ78759.1 hypothetical protein BABINDRAFT_162447 [Babjeviella inositovora NRRL Y-12698]